MRPLTGVVLGGGQSRRMGRDKARIAVAGEMLATRAVRRLEAALDVATHGDGGVVVADRGRRIVPGAVSVDDGPGRGPAAGILGAAAACPGHDLLVLACDLPNIPTSLLVHLAVGRDDVDWLVPRHDRLEPLCSRFGARALAALAERVANGEHALHPLSEYPGLEVCFLSDTVLGDDPAVSFINVNRPEDLVAFDRIRYRRPVDGR